MEQSFWEKRYQNNETGWDLGNISTPIKTYIDQLENKELKILIPGCGFGHEAIYIYNQGFKNTYILDFSEIAIETFKKQNPSFPLANIFNADFFKHQNKYDIIIEQTLFCAIDPKNRTKYAEKVKELLKPNGKLIGLLFDCEFIGGPPFGGSNEEYYTLFSKYFSKISIEKCYNSITPRKDKEVFVKLAL